MRPHILKLKAFGPFAKETVVDFDAMGNDIYLICGDTGSGKTSIFDGVMYALYGTASGRDRSGLNTEELQSHYARDGRRRDEMRVLFTFSNAGRTFTVERRMYWGRRGDSQTVTKESSLAENGTDLVYGRGREDRDDVTKKVTEILGLDADQFRRIIMLAQGEFQKFLAAKSDERGAILGKLYDNRRHQDLQLRLKAARVLLKKLDDATVDETNAQLNVFELPDFAAEEDRAAMAADHPGLLSAMERILAQTDEALGELSKEISVREGALDDLKKEKARGEERNGLLDQLEQKKKELENLDREKDAMDSLRKRLDKAEQAERVLPFEEALARAKADLSASENRIRELEEEKKRLENTAAILQERAETAEEENTPIIAGLNREAAELNSILPYYKELSDSLQLLSDRKDAFEEAERKEGEARRTLEAREKRQGELARDLDRLEPAGAAAVEIAGNRLDLLAKRRKELAEMRVSVGRVERLIREEADAARKLLEARLEETKAEGKHLDLNRKFIQGQAGLIAKDMREKLLTAPEVVCPVCGAVHTGADVSGFAPLHEGVPTQDQVDEAYEAWQKAQAAVRLANDARGKKEKELSGEKKALLSKAEELLSVSQWEDLSEGSVLSEETASCEERRKAAEEAYRRAVKDRADKEKAVAEKADADEKAEAARGELSAAVEKRAAAEKEAEAAEESVRERRERLRGYPENEDGARALIEAKRKKAEDLQRETDGAKKKLSVCRNRQSGNMGSLNGARNDRQSREDGKNRAALGFADQLEKAGFADEAAYRAALSPEGEPLDPERLGAWIRGKKEALDAYHNRRGTLDAEIRLLAESTKGQARADVDDLQKRIAKASRELEELRERKESLSSKSRTDRTVYDKIVSIQGEHRKYTKAAEILNPLADAADGRYAFSRYVLTDFFHRIVEQANLHLDTLTDGSFCLVPKETGDGRTNTGLDLKVLYTFTGVESETALLSGGQKFEASLALALGLSDVVQMESSGIRIDSMFIDEGFGSLDSLKLRKAVDLLKTLSDGKRQIGIISHVAGLHEFLQKRFRVTAGEQGSTVSIETDV